MRRTSECCKVSADPRLHRTTLQRHKTVDLVRCSLGPADTWHTEKRA